jgi:hypothetical protein
MIAVDSTGANPVTRKVTLQSVVSIPNNLAQSAYALANSGYIHANSSFNFANTVNVYSTSSFDKANVAYNLAVGSNLDSLVIVTSSPVTPTGNTGDDLGMVYLANDAFFYCTSAYDGASNIWSKIVASDSW